MVKGVQIIPEGEITGAAIAAVGNFCPYFYSLPRVCRQKSGAR
jgi:hypothetical protein